MARSCGIRIGPRRFELVVLDGGAKKHKITAYMSGELPREGADPIATASAALREAVKLHNVPKDNVGIAIDTGLAAFRMLKVPFKDKAKIEEVIKFEIEGQLPQWNVDEVVVDFQVLDSTDEASELLVTAVPKAELKAALAICERAGVEPLEAELETTAMVNAAMVANLCTIDNAQVLVHIGETSTSVVVMDGGKVREMRAIHIGALSHEFPTSAGEVEVLAEGAEAPAVPVPPPDTARDPVEVQRRLEQAIKRIRRELGRTVSAARTIHTIEAVYVCGLELPGLAGSKILDVDVRVLDVFEADGGQPAEGFGPLVVPYGVAVRQLGGGTLRPSLRREELHYSGAFERIELPLAVVSLLLITFLGVWLIFLTKEKNIVDGDHLVYWRDSTRNYLLGVPSKGGSADLKFPPDKIKDYIQSFEKDSERTKLQQLKRVQTMLGEDIRRLEKDLGQDAEITQPQSALVGLTLVLDVLAKGMNEQTNRPSLRKVQATYQQGRQGKPDHVHVLFDVTFFATTDIEASQNYENFIKDLQAMPWYVDFDRRGSKPAGNGLYYSGIAVDVDVSKAPLSKEAQ